MILPETADMGCTPWRAAWRSGALLAFLATPLAAGATDQAIVPGEVPPAAEPLLHAPVIMGWNERVLVYPSGLEFRAKLDTGARTSSIHATAVREFRRNGRNWVKVTIDNGRGATADLELLVRRFVRIREHGGSYQRRPVVKMGICVGELYKETEVNLVDRTGFIYPLLIGRAFLKNDILVDATVTKTREPDCGNVPGGGPADADGNAQRPEATR